MNRIILLISFSLLLVGCGKEYKVGETIENPLIGTFKSSHYDWGTHYSDYTITFKENGELQFTWLGENFTGKYTAQALHESGKVIDLKLYVYNKQTKELGKEPFKYLTVYHEDNGNITLKSEGFVYEKL